MNRKIILAALAAAFAAAVVGAPALAKKKSTRIDRINACRADAAVALDLAKQECRRIWGKKPSLDLETCYAVAIGNFRADIEECKHIP